MVNYALHPQGCRRATLLRTLGREVEDTCDDKCDLCEHDENEDVVTGEGDLAREALGLVAVTEDRGRRNEKGGITLAQAVKALRGSKAQEVSSTEFSLFFGSCELTIPFIPRSSGSATTPSRTLALRRARRTATFAASSSCSSLADTPSSSSRKRRLGLREVAATSVASSSRRAARKSSRRGRSLSSR